MKGLFHDHATKISRKNRFCMSKQSEAKIGVGTSLTVCYSKNDSPINLRGGKYVVLDVVVVMSTVRTFTDASTPSDSLVC